MDENERARPSLFASVLLASGAFAFAWWAIDFVITVRETQQHTADHCRTFKRATNIFNEIDERLTALESIVTLPSPETRDNGYTRN